jgi:N-acetylneuraminate synthase
MLGSESRVHFIAEAGINHNGDLALAKALMLMAKTAGADSVKFQKRDPDVCVPNKQKTQIRETPWGEMTYLDYKKRIEFNLEEYLEIEAY